MNSLPGQKLPSEGDDSRFFAELPADLAAEIPAGDQVLYRIATDMNLAALFEPAFLVLTDKHVLGLSKGEAPVCVPLKDIKESRIDEQFGGGRLMVKTEPGEVAIVSYSRDLVPEFAAAGRIIDDLANGRTVVLPELEGAAHSERSGVPLPERGARSPMDVPRLEIFRRMFEFIAPYKARLTIMTVAMLTAVVAQMSIPLITRSIVDGVLHRGEVRLAADNAEAKLGLFALCIAGAFLLISCARLIGNSMTTWMSGRITADLRTRLHNQMQLLTMGYHNKREVGQLISRVMGDTGELQHFLVDGVPYLIVNTLSFVSIASILLYLNPFLALFVFLPVPFLLGGGGWFWKRLVPLFHKRGSRHSMLHTTLAESIRGIKAVKSLTQEKRRHETFARNNESLFGIHFIVETTWIRFFEAMSLIMGLGTVAVWYFGGRSILNPESTFTFGDLIAFIGYMSMFYGPLQWFTAVVNWMTQAFSSAERILQVLDQKPETYDAPDAVDMPKVEGAICFKDVRFSYNRGKEVLKGVSFDIAPGEMIGLVGRSGAGKSTIINMICRFYDVDSGMVTVDGHDLRKVKLEQWRKNVGIVMQDPFLFSATIRDNISYGKPDATFEDVMRAARAAEAHEFILDKEEGYDTVVGEGGVSLSGGECQRIAIARAILNDPPVLILDEATSAIDSETEAAIQKAIGNLVKGRTTIAIAHRLATLRHASRLVVIDDGVVAEIGTHEALLAKEDGHFAKLVRLQSENNRLRAEQQAYSDA